jgi:hypothetical protein
MADARIVAAKVDGPSGAINLPDDGTASVMISALTWDAGTTVELEGSTHGNQRWAPVKNNGVAVSTTGENILLTVEGNGPIRMNVSGIGTTTGLELSVSYR